MSRMIQLVVLSLTLSFSLVACSDDAGGEKSSYQPGTDYEVLPTPLHTEDPDKIEVAEFFWYGCPHCYHFEPSISTWLKSIPKDVNFVRIPAMWSADMELHAKMYYTARQLNKLADMHEAFFTAMQAGKMRLGTKEEIGKLFTDHGVSAEDFNKTFDSFGIDSLVKQAQAKASGAKVTGTPELLVNGKYRVTAKLAGGSQANMLKIVDFLINKERREQK